MALRLTAFFLSFFKSEKTTSEKITCRKTTTKHSSWKRRTKTVWLSKSELFLSISQLSIIYKQLKDQKSKQPVFTCKLQMKVYSIGQSPQNKGSKPLIANPPVSRLLRQIPEKTRVVTGYHDSGHIQVLREESGRQRVPLSIPPANEKEE